MSVSETYRLFGLAIASELPLPELHPVAKAAEPDVRVRRSVIPPELPKAPGLHHLGSVSLLNIAGVASYLCEGVASLLVEPCAGVPDRNVRLFLLGSAMALVLHRRGLLPLHGNSVVVDGRAHLFLGPSGSGKSTLAAGFIRRGYDFLADDVSVIRVDGDAAVVQPGLPRLRLWRDAIEKAGESVCGLQRSYVEDEEGFDKFDVSAARVARSAVPLGSIVLLDRSDQASLTPLVGAEALAGLFANIYRGEYLSGEQQAAQWRTCLTLAGSAPVRIWHRRWGYQNYDDELDRLLAMLESEFPAA